jgi:hypothetical protein
MIRLNTRSLIVAKINWDEYKKYKRQRENVDGLDNFEIMLEFLRSFYNKTTSFEVFDILDADSLGKMMLEKRDISKPEHLDEYLYRRLSR